MYDFLSPNLNLSIPKRFGKVQISCQIIVNNKHYYNILTD
jgi:hypothetical protein